MDIGHKEIAKPFPSAPCMQAQSLVGVVALISHVFRKGSGVVRSATCMYSRVPTTSQAQVWSMLKRVRSFQEFAKAIVTYTLSGGRPSGTVGKVLAWQSRC